MPLPNFLCVGAQKAGTTSLYHILKQHPEIFLPQCKEVHFFNNDENFKYGEKWYRKFYDFSRKFKVYGDFTPIYMYLPKVPHRIYATLGEEVKLLFMLRHPVDRAYSHYKMNKRNGIEKKSFVDALKQEPIHKSPENDTNYHYSYIRRGLYAQQIKRLLNFFPLKNMFFASFEKLFVSKKHAELNSILEFLEVKKADLKLDIKSNESQMPKNKFAKFLFQKHNPIRKLRKVIMPNRKIRKTISKRLTKSPPPLQEKAKKKLFEKYFESDVYELEKITGKKFKWHYYSKNPT